MRIAVNGYGLEKNVGIFALLEAMALQNSAHEFVLLSDKPTLSLQAIRSEIIGAPVNSLLAKRWWLDVKLPLALRKCKADVLLNINGDLSLRTKLPQLLFANSLLFLRQPKQFSSAEVLFMKFYLPKYFEKAAVIITPSQFLKNELVNQFNLAPEKIVSIQIPVSSFFGEGSGLDLQQTKDSFTGGDEYFFFNGGFDAANNTLAVIKAFSHFKKWQRSSMKLVITGDSANESIAEKLRTFKFRDDVIVVEQAGQEQIARLMAASYAFIHVPVYDASGSEVIAALRSNTAVITSKIGAITEVAGEAAMYVDKTNDETISAQMIRLHKDEMLRADLVEQGKSQAKKYNDGTAAARLWQIIQDAVAGDQKE